MVAPGTIRAARELFNELAKSVFSAPQIFFETTPLGRILSRLTFDIDVIDHQVRLAARCVLRAVIC